MRRKTKLLFLLCGILVVVVAAYCIYWLAADAAEVRQQKEIYAELETYAQEEAGTIPASVLPVYEQTEQAVPQEDAPEIPRHDMQKLRVENPDCVGWITFVGTEVSFPVMYTPQEPEYYLHRNFKRDYSSYGTPFIKATGLEAVNLNLYGHHMRDGGMFAPLMQYKEARYLEAHRLILLEGVDTDRYYEIVAAVHCDAKKDIGLFGYMDASGFAAYEEALHRLTGKETAAEADRLLTVITCDKTDNSSGRLLLIAREIPE